MVDPSPCGFPGTGTLAHANAGISPRPPGPRGQDAVAGVQRLRFDAEEPSMMRRKLHAAAAGAGAPAFASGHRARPGPASASR